MSKSEKRVVVAIDGPAASGKSTVALALARHLGFQLLDSGSMYRAVTLLAVENGVSTDDEERLVEIAGAVRRDFRLEMPDEERHPRVLVSDRDVTDEIRSTRVGEAVSPVSKVTGVRREMVQLQREMLEERGAVVEGRDIGTTVFPDAPLKIYLDATQDERVRRRTLELEEKGVRVMSQQVKNEIQMRDAIDSSRESSPLSMAPDAVLVDTTGKTVAQVVDEVVMMFEDRGFYQERAVE